METSVHKLSDWCVESVWTQLYTSCQTDVWSLYGHICTQDIRLMCVVCMETSVNKLSDWCLESVWRHLYTICQPDVWNLYGDISTPVVRLMCGVCILTSLHKNIRLMCGVSMEIFLHQLSYWCVESVWKHHYTSWQTDVWSLCSDIFTEDNRLMCGVRI
jgi:hypothetical protein